MPNFESLSPEEIEEELDPPEIGKISRKDGGPLEKGLPAYLVEPAIFELKLLDDIRLIDFGECMYPCKWLGRRFD